MIWSLYLSSLCSTSRWVLGLSRCGSCINGLGHSLCVLVTDRQLMWQPGGLIFSLVKFCVNSNLNANIYITVGASCSVVGPFINTTHLAQCILCAIYWCLYVIRVTNMSWMWCCMGGRPANQSLNALRDWWFCSLKWRMARTEISSGLINQIYDLTWYSSHILSMGCITI